MARKFIIDTSNVNPGNRTQIRASQVVALIAKATEGTNFKDGVYDSQRGIARSLKIPFGSYVFWHPSSSGNEAEFYLKWAKPRKGDIQPIIDTEVTDGKSMQAVANRVWSGAQYLTHNGYDPIIYGSSSWILELVALKPGLKNFRIWEAQYPGRFARWFPGLAAKRIKLRHGLSVVMWQFTDSYEIAGHKFDCSVLLTDLKNIQI